jgi:nitrate reductase assembly molybdenum cofactor insertion protein NarJ
MLTALNNSRIELYARQHEYARLGRRLRRGQQFYSDVINALRARTKNHIYHVKYEFERNSSM